MLKVAIMLEKFSIGGAQRVVSELVKNLDQTNIELKVICCEKRADTKIAREVEKIAKIDYLELEGENIFKRFFNVFQCLNRFRPDIINTHLTPHMYAIPWGIMHKKPVIITAHTKPEKAFVKKIEPLIRWSLKYSKAFIVAVSQENLNLIKNYFNIDNKRCCYINNGINVKDFYKKEHKHFTFINVARQDENKNQAVILRCFAKIHANYPDTRLILLGDGPLHKHLVDLSKELKLSGAVDFPGSKGNVADYYAISDVYVQSSHREALPMSILEALATGLPIVSTDVGGIRDVVNGNGYLVPDTDEDALLECMQRIMTMSPEKLNELQKKSRDLSEKYSSVNMADEYEELFYNLERL